MEIAKFILTAVGTFLSVLGLSFTIFQHWRKKQDEKFELLKNNTQDLIQKESQSRDNSNTRLEKRIERLEQSIVQSFEGRLSGIEGELKGMKPVLQAIQNWFIRNTPAG